jgi:outer membrane protein TolC
MDAGQIQSAQIEIERTKDELRPQLDLSASYSQGGRDASAGSMLSGLRNRQDDSYSVGIQGALSIGNRVAKGAHRRAKLTRREMEQRKAQSLQQLELGVHRAFRQVDSNQILVESTRQARHLQEANVVAEEKRLQLGMTTRYQVLQTQEDLTGARTQEVQAQIALAKARTDLLLAEGRLLEEQGIVFEGEDGVPPAGFESDNRPSWE